jgi:hypothetical protein
MQNAESKMEKEGRAAAVLLFNFAFCILHSALSL